MNTTEIVASNAIELPFISIQHRRHHSAVVLVPATKSEMASVRNLFAESRILRLHINLLLFVIDSCIGAGEEK